MPRAPAKPNDGIVHAMPIIVRASDPYPVREKKRLADVLG
jgi:hypothetical protein